MVTFPVRFSALSRYVRDAFSDTAVESMAADGTGGSGPKWAAVRGGLGYSVRLAVDEGEGRVFVTTLELPEAA